MADLTLAVRRPVLALCTLLTLGACAEGDGIVEVAWQFDDAGLQRIFPQGSLPDTCEFASASVRFSLVVRLRILENSAACADDPNADDCQEVLSETFPCYRYRGTAETVAVSAPAEGGSDEGYLMLVEALIDPTDTPAFVPVTTCVKSPGPRVRKVLPGRITDLELQQFIVTEPALTDGSADLDNCRSEASP